MSKSRPRVIAPIVLGVCGVAVLLFLGAWQVQRLAWKQQLISDLETRAAAEPVSLPASPNAQRDAYLRVAVQGLVEPDELNVLTSIKNVGPGFRVIAPLTVEEDGRRIMVDLGFVTEANKDVATREASIRSSGETERVELVGLLYWPPEDSYAPPPDAAREMWFSRDLSAMSRALSTSPILVVAESHSLGSQPLPRPPGVDLPNNHLEYAITWFSLAVVWTVMSVYWFMSQVRGSRARRKD